MTEEKRTPYAKGKIYKLTVDDLVYYGSTVQTLSKRIGGHRSDYKSWKNGKQNYVTSFKLFEDDKKPIITLVEDFPCERKEQLTARERYYIENNECVNKVIPGRSRTEWFEQHTDHIKEYKKTYYEQNKEKIQDYRSQNADKLREQQREYNKTHSSDKSEYMKQYRKENADKIREQKKDWNNANKDKIHKQNKIRIQRFYDKKKAASG